MNSRRSRFLRNILQQIVALDRNVASRIDRTNEKLDSFVRATTENFGRVQRNFERLRERDEDIDDLRDRLAHVERHVGLRDR